MRSIRRMIQPNPLDSRCVMVTPEMAAKWLQDSAVQRAVRPQTVDSYGRDMKAGNFRWCGDTIIFNEQGQMTDGQHRCLASVKFGVPFEAMLIRNLPADRTGKINTGIKRSGGDVFKLEGIENYNLIHSALRLLWRYRATGDSLFTGLACPTNDELLAILRKEPGIKKWVSRGQGRAKAIGHGSVWITLAYLFECKAPQEVELFIEKAVDGMGLSKHDSFKPLRDQLLAAKAARRPMQTREFTAKVIKTWNAYRAGRRMTALRFMHETEGFPTIE